MTLTLITDINDDRMEEGPYSTALVIMRMSLRQAIRERDRAIRALKSGGYEDLGGAEWKPPVNQYATLYHQNRVQFETLVREVLDAVNKSVDDEEAEYEDTMGHEIR